MTRYALRAALATTRLSMGTAQDAAVTIAHRLPILTAALLAPTPARLAEARLATFEKLAAATEGMFAAGVAWQKLWIDCACGRVTTSTLPPRLGRLAAVATKPARRRVRANARRLSRTVQ